MGTIEIKMNMSKMGHYRSHRPELFLGEDILKICSKFTGNDPCGSGIAKQPY